MNACLRTRVLRTLACEVLLEVWLVLGVGYFAAAATFPNDYVIQKISAVPEMTIRAMIQTRDGYLWLGGYKGLGRFDGVRLRWFTMSDTPTLSSDAVYVLCEDRSGNLWIGTDDGGIIRYRDGEFVSFGPEQGMTQTEVRSICQDRDGTLWVGTRQGLFYLANERFAACSAANSLRADEINELAAAPDGSLWIGSSRGLFRLMPGSTQPLGVLTNRYVQSVALDPHGVIWANLDWRANVRIPCESVGADIKLLPIRYGWFHMGCGGSFLLAGTEGTLFRLPGDGSTNPIAEARFEKRRFSSLCEDSEGNIWAGIESHGLYRLHRKQVATHSTASGLQTDALTTITEDKTGRVWLGTWGRGLLVAENGSMTFDAVRVPAVANVTAFLQRGDSSLWLGTYGGPSFELVNTQLVARPKLASGCRVIYEDRDSALWVGTLTQGVERHRDGQVTRFTTREGLASDLIRSIVQDAVGDIWIATARGLNRLSNGSVTRFNGEEALARQAILGLYVDGQGALWAGTAGAGLVRYHNNHLQTITTRHGLASNWIEQILEDDHGHLWFGTEAGIFRASRADLETCAEGRTNFINCLTLGPEDGMLAANCGSGFKPSCMKSRSGSLWFCTPGGLAVVDPKKVQPRSQPPPVHIEEVMADDQVLSLLVGQGREPPAVIVKAGVPRVSFHYIALNFSAPDKLRFRYLLEGYDENWVSAGVAREAIYTRLPAGTYRFRVTATNKDGVANDIGATLGVTVIPPWWQMWWFRGVAIVALSGLVLGLYELRVYQHKKARTMQESFARRLIESQEQERKRVAAELHDSLGQSLQIIKGRAQLALSRGDRPDEKDKQFAEISEAATQAIREVRSSSHALRPAELDPL